MKETEKERGATPITACYSRLHVSLSIAVETESVGQMFANRPVDGHAPDLEWEELYCPGKRA